MPQFLSPDVFESEVQGKSQNIPNASTSAYACGGYSPSGPEGVALLSTSFTQFVNQFGGFSNKSFNAYSVAAYFLNGGNRNWFVRQMHSDAVAATGNFAAVSGVAYYNKAKGRGVWANGAEITIAGDPSFYNPLTAQYSRFSVTNEVINPTTGLLAVSEVFDQVILTDPSDPDYILSIIEAESEDIIMTVGAGGIPVSLLPVSFSGVSFGSGDGDDHSFVSSALSAKIPLAPGVLQVSVSGVAAAVDDGNGNWVAVSGNPFGSVSGSIDYAGGNSSIYFGTVPANSAPVAVNGITAPAASVTITLSGGVDGSEVVAADVVNVSLQGTQAGIYAFDLVNEEMSINFPDYVGDYVTDLSVITYVNNRADMVAIISPPQGMTPQNAVNWRRNTLKSQSSYAAMYYPWVKVPDPLNNNRPLLMPPGGHVAGRYAYTDNVENVGKAPAGISRGQLNFISGVERVLTKGDRDTLYPAQINPIRSDSIVGTAIWGNKTLQIIGDYTDVNVRRTFINLEKEQYQGLMDIVFENIGPVTYSLITLRLDAYLENKYLLGVIGSGCPTKNIAYKIVCDETNNTQSIQDAKMIIIDEYIKPDIAAEYIWLRLQKTDDASQM